MLQRTGVDGFGDVRRGSADVEVDAEDDQEPQEDREQGGQDDPQNVHGDVVMGPRHVDPNDDVDQGEQADATHGGSAPSPPQACLARTAKMCPVEVWRKRGAPARPTGPRSGGDQAAHLVAAGDHWSVTPEPLEVVVLALLLMEDVHHDVDEVQQDPVRLALALAAQRPGALLTTGALDLLGDRANLAIV